MFPLVQKSFLSGLSFLAVADGLEGAYIGELMAYMHCTWVSNPCFVSFLFYAGGAGRAGTAFILYSSGAACMHHGAAMA
jgi:hypothetical protein